MRGQIVLVVDDWPDQLVLMQRILAPLDVDTFTAADGAEALALLRAHTVALVIADRQMPRVDGEELVAQMRRDPELAAIPVIIVSGSPQWPDDAPAPDLLLAKPLDADEVREHVQRLLGLGSTGDAE